jgi:hypothetical protein
LNGSLRVPEESESVLQGDHNAACRRNAMASWPFQAGALLLMLGMVGLFSLAKIGQYAPHASWTHLISRTMKMGEGRQVASIPKQDSPSTRRLVQCFSASLPFSMLLRTQIGIPPFNSAEFSTADIHRAPPVLLI